MLHQQHHHSAASPARLGLSNPSFSSSPSLPPNPTPKPPPPPSSSSSSPSPSSSTSSTLLSLLPPLPRAQSLLLQMSSLASKLFDVSPNRSLWSSSYRSSLPSFLPNSPPTTDSSSSSSSTTTKDILSLFHSLQTSLFESVAQLQEILDLQDSTATLARHIRSADASLLSFAKKIQESESVLDRLVDDYSDLYRPRPALPLRDLLAYAHRISYTTFAPPDHGAGLAPLRGALPPAPQDNEMRASQLYHFADLDVGVPARKKAKTDGEEAAAGAADDVLMEPTPPREEVAVPAGAMLPIAVPPPGWKKGMPVELPPMPAGWKPGDPVPLPPAGWKPGDPVPLPPLDGKEEERQQPRGVPKAPEAIQVKYVQLDIPEEDDYSSEYSSEDGSSDEDED